MEGTNWPRSEAASRSACNFRMLIVLATMEHREADKEGAYKMKELTAAGLRREDFWVNNHWCNAAVQASSIRFDKPLQVTLTWRGPANVIKCTVCNQ